MTDQEPPQIRAFPGCETSRDRARGAVTHIDNAAAALLKRKGTPKEGDDLAAVEEAIAMRAAINALVNAGTGIISGLLAIADSIYDVAPEPGLPGEIDELVRYLDSAVLQLGEGDDAAKVITDAAIATASVSPNDPGVVAQAARAQAVGAGRAVDDMLDGLYRLTGVKRSEAGKRNEERDQGRRR